MVRAEPAPADALQFHDGSAVDTKTSVSSTGRVQILVEIVGAINLAPHPELSGGDSILPNGPGTLVSSRLFLADDGQASPYVKVTWGDVTIHTTDTIQNSNDPIWAIDSGSLFLLDASLSDLVGGNRPKVLVFEVRDKDNLLGNSAQLGTVRIKADRLLQSCNEERVEFNIEGGALSAAREQIMDWDDGDAYDEQLAASLLGATATTTFDEREDDANGKLALRFRLATEDDLRFMRCLERQSFEEIDRSYSDSNDDMKKRTGNAREANMRSSDLITDKDEGSVGVQGMLDSFSFAFNATTTDREGNVRIRVKPGPDPQRPEKTTFLSEAEILAATYAPSKKWVEAGSGELGRVFVEILRAEGLPNMDGGAVGDAVGNKTDAFVTLAYEDAMVQTDRIDDALSPMWMPWSQRAFAFNRMHPLSSLFIAVFDYDLGPTAHDGIGRVAINLEQFRPDTVYTLKYNLYPSSTITDRESMGKITIRLRLETPDEKSFLMETIKQTPRMHINVKKEKSLAVAKYTCYGQYDEDKYDMKLLKSYVNELLDYKRTVSYSICDALKSLLLWRGQVKVGILNLPLHSMFMFMIGTHVVERPHLVPSLSCFCVAWFMLASYLHRVQHPSPWHRCRSIGDYVSVLRHGKAPSSSTGICARQGAKEAEALKQAWKKRLQADTDAANKRWELQQELDGIGDEKIHTEQNGLQIDPLTRLFPIQKRLHGVCYVFRLIKCVLTWEDSATSFWITAVSIGLSVALYILPTMRVIHWICRILVYTVLGPWMKLVDFIFLSTVDFESDEERRKHKDDTVKALVKRFKEMRTAARIKGEDALKLKAVRVLRFGEFIARVPSRNVTRHYDYPLPESTALPVKQCPAYPVPVKGWADRKVSPGQKLHGSMIPVQRPSDSSSEAKERLGALLQKIGAENQKSALQKNLAREKQPSALTTSTSGGGSNDLKDEEGFETELTNAIVQISKAKQAIRNKREHMEQIDEGGENEVSIVQMSSADKLLSVPPHIASAAGSTDGTSVTSASASTDEIDSVCCSQRTENVHDNEKAKGVLEEGVEVLSVARHDAPFPEGALDARPEPSDNTSKTPPAYQSSDHVHFIFVED